MTKLQVDAYYDITCQECGGSWSTDFNARERKMNPLGDGGMGMATSAQWLQKKAYTYGWKCRDGKTLCPECLEKSKTIGG